MKHKILVMVSLAVFIHWFFCGAAMGARPVEPKVEVDRPVVMQGGAGVVYVLVTFEVEEHKEDPARPRPKLNLGLVIDRSGSMEEKGKLTYAKRAANILIDGLKPSDRIAVVEYDDKITVLWPSSPAESPNMIKRRIAGLSPRGSTNLTGGMLRGVDEVLKNSGKGYMNRVLLLSDGLANKGITRPPEIRRLVREARQKGVCISAMGLGINYDEDLMQMIAENAAGRYYFIESPTQMAEIYRQEMSMLFTTVAKDVEMRFSPGKNVSKSEVFGFPFKVDNRQVTIEQSDFYSGETRSVLMRLEIVPQNKGKLKLGELSLAYNDPEKQKNRQVKKTLTVHATDSIEEVNQAMNKAVVTEAALIEAEVAHEQAVTLFENGQKQDALDAVKKISDELVDKNQELKDVKLSKKIEALKMEAGEMRAAEHSRAQRSVYLKKSKQRLYQARKGKRGQYIQQEGDHGHEVFRLQRELRAQGFYRGPVDGVYGLEVKKAVEEVQQMHNLEVDGIAGPATLKVLGQY